RLRRGQPQQGDHPLRRRGAARGDRSRSRDRRTRACRGSAAPQSRRLRRHTRTAARRNARRGRPIARLTAFLRGRTRNGKSSTLRKDGRGPVGGGFPVSPTVEDRVAPLYELDDLVARGARLLDERGVEHTVLESPLELGL